MLKQCKLKIAVAFAVATVTGNALAAATDDVDIIAPTAGSTISSTQPVIWFPYAPAVDGYLIDVTQVDSATAPSLCGTTTYPGVATYWVTASDSSVDCSHTVAPPDSDTPNAADSLCTWTIPAVLTDKKNYGVNVSPVKMNAGTGGFKLEDSAARINSNCAGTNKAYQTFRLDTSTGAVPANKPEQVVITSPALNSTTGLPETCINAAGANANGNCAIQWMHPNNPGLPTWYKVWIEDKNNVRIGDDTISDNGTQADYGFGYFKMIPSHVGAEETVACAVNINNDLRTCTLNIGSTAGLAVFPGGTYTVWVQAWNAKGLSLWSTSHKFKK